MKRRFLAWLLCTVMLFNNALPVFATEGKGEQIIIENTDTTTETTSESTAETEATTTASSAATEPTSETTEPETEAKEEEITSSESENTSASEETSSETTTEAADGEKCECGLPKDHEGECQQTIIVCEKCQSEPCVCCDDCGVAIKDGAEHATDCPTRCTCTPVDGIHQTGCELSHNIPLCDKCEATMVDGVLTHEDGCYYTIKCENCEKFGHTADDCEACPECKQTAEEGHASNCPIALMNLAEAAVGKTALMPEGTTVYFSPNAGEIGQWSTQKDNQITIEKVFVDESNVVWYKYSNSNVINLHPWVKATDVTIIDEDYFEEVNFDTFEGITDNGMITVDAVEDIFEEGTEIFVEETTVDETEVISVLDNADTEMKYLGMYAFDITFSKDGSEVQPNDRVNLKIELPAENTPDGANMIAVVHFGENGAELVGTTYLSNDTDTHVVSVAVEGFSSYAAVYVNGKYVSQKMSDVLAGNDRYSVETFNIDLFDYEPVAFNASLNNATDDGNGFHFTGYGVAGCGSNSGINNTAAENAKQGILEANLTTEGLPVIDHLDGDNAGVNTGKILFSDTYQADGKTIYNDIPFEFIYDNQTEYYVYKSSANHAQLNEAGTKIELYADTLSTQNAHKANIAVNSPDGNSSYVTDEVKSSPYSAKAKFNAEGTRMDPYVTYPVANISSNDVGLIYVKLKVDSAITSNRFALFFKYLNADGTSTSWTENCTYRVEYTSNGDWIEIVIDTSDCSDYEGTIENTWANKTITGIRIDPFDSNTNAGNLDTTAQYDFEIAQISFITKNYDDYVTRGGFYPFSEIEDSFPGNNTAFDLGEWSEFMAEDGAAQKRASRAIFNPSPSPSTDIYNELAYGVVMEFPFYIPVNAEHREGLNYYFNGDDDLWVFIDGELVLDIGGGHGAITGTIDFENKKVNVANAITIDGYNSNKADAGEKEIDLADKFVTPGKHTMKVFYLERGGSVSNCFMKFNLPLVPDGDVSVTKNVEHESHDPNRSYNFTITAKPTEYTSSELETNVKYIKSSETNAANVNWIKIMAQDGTTVDYYSYSFTLGDGETISFEGIPESTEISVEESSAGLTSGSNYFKYIGTDLEVTGGNKIETYKGTGTITEGGQFVLIYTNKYQDVYGSLTINKVIDNHVNPDQSFMFHVIGTCKNTKHIDMTVTVPIKAFTDGNGSTTIAHLPGGEYTVTEIVDWSWRYTISESDTVEKTAIITGVNPDQEAQFKNYRSNIYWMDGEAWCKNVFTGSVGQNNPLGDYVLVPKKQDPVTGN